MNRTVRPLPLVMPPPVPKRRLLSRAERAELQRQGAKAAARGETAGTNPLGHARNKPPATGESVDKWLQRHDAWEQGHEAQSISRQAVDPAVSCRDLDEDD